MQIETPPVFSPVHQLDFVQPDPEEDLQAVGLVEHQPQGEQVLQIPAPIVIENPVLLYQDSDSDSDDSDLMAESKSLDPGVFSGRPDENPDEWIRRFENYCAYKEMSDAKKLALIKVLLIHHAGVWLESLDFANIANFTAFKTLFNERFKAPEMMKFKAAKEMFTKKQGERESVDTFIESMRKLAKDIGADDNMTIFAILAGLKPNIANYVTQMKPTTLTELTTHARVAELTTADQSSDQLMELKEEIKQLSSKLTAAPVAANRWSPSSSPAAQRKVTFSRDYQQGYATGENSDTVRRPVGTRFNERVTDYPRGNFPRGPRRGNEDFYRHKILEFGAE